MAPRVRRIMPHRENRAPTYWHGQSEKPRRAARRPESESSHPDGPTAAPKESSEAAPASPATPAAQPTFFIATLGDTLGILLANGLRDGFADRPDVSVLHDGKESSGLVRDDFYDWSKAARDIAGGAQKINVAVVMIGSNDRQAFHRGGETFEALSPQWRSIYVARVDALLAAFKEKNIPVIWVGLPVMKSEHFSADMSKLNDIYRERVARVGAAYVDLWENMADEKGQYSAFGPDINGQIVKLRTADGVNLTAPGARSVAHFVELEIKKIYDARKQPVPQANAPGAAAPRSDAAKADASKSDAPTKPLIFRSPVAGPTAAPTLPERPAIGAVQSLDAAIGGAAELARRAPAAAAGADAAKALAQHVFVEGGDQPSRPNRADDYSWRAAAPKSPAAPQPASTP